MSGLSVNEEYFRQFVNATSDMVYRMSPDWETMYEFQGHDFLKMTDLPFKDWREYHVHPYDV